MKEITQEILNKIIEAVNMVINTGGSPTLDLKYRYLRGLDFTQLHEGIHIDFTGSDMRDTNFKKVALEQVVFDECNLARANFERTKMCDVSFKEACLNEVNLKRSCIREVDFSRADLTCIDMTLTYTAYINLTGARLGSANFTRTTLYRAVLKETTLDFASLPMWCGSLDIITDSTIKHQLAYHLAALYVASEEPIPEQIKELANKSHVIEKHDLPKF